MSTRNMIQASLEAIDYQKNSPLFQELVAKLRPFIESEVRFQSPDHFRLLGLDKIILHHTGVWVDFKYNPYTAATDAAIEPPVLDLNSPLLNGWRAYGYGEEAFVPMLKTLKDLEARQADLKAMIDLPKGRVGGLFSKVCSNLYLGAGLWRSLRMSVEEVAAVILHEVGHAFTFFEAFLHVVPTNLALVTAQRALSKTDSQEQRLQLIDALADTMSLDPATRESLKKSGQSGQSIMIIAVKGYMQQLRSGSGAWEYEMRNSEFAADQFATRQGAGRYLVTGLDKLHRVYDDSYRLGAVGVWAFRLFELLSHAILSVFSFGTYPAVMLLLFLFTDPVGSGLYDPPSARFARIRRDLVQTLKREDLHKDLRADLVSQVEQIDKISHGLQEHMSLLEGLWRLLRRPAARQKSMIEFQQELEQLVNNDLFVQASKFKTLT